MLSGWAPVASRRVVANGLVSKLLELKVPRKLWQKTTVLATALNVADFPLRWGCLLRWCAGSSSRRVSELGELGSRLSQNFVCRDALRVRELKKHSIVLLFILKGRANLID